MNIKAPVNVPPMMPITKSKRGIISAINTATAIISERTTQRFILNALKIGRDSFEYVFLAQDILNSFTFRNIETIFNLLKKC